MAEPSGARKTTERANQLRINEKKWSKTLMDAGWTAFPNVLVERQQALGLDALDINILLHLATYWWTADNKPHPAKATIARALNVAPRTVQRRVADLERAGLIKREQRRIRGSGSKSNVYHFDGLIAAAQPYAKEKMEGIAARKKARDSAFGRKGRPDLRVVEFAE